jgi:S-adenosylmethionine synthetase
LSRINILINSTGLIGGSGLTGRKIIFDTYDGCAKHWCVAFSAKHICKADCSTCYYAIALADADLADTCEVCVSYSIGVASPVAVSIDTFGTGVMTNEKLLELDNQHFDFTPSNIKKELEFEKFKFREIAVYRHMGREDLPVRWEHVEDKVVKPRIAHGNKSFCLISTSLIHGNLIEN